jgi:hypothetical protein
VTADPRVARLRSLDTTAAAGLWNRDSIGAMVRLVEGVLERHVECVDGVDCWYCNEHWPCADAVAALAVLDTLDPP